MRARKQNQQTRMTIQEIFDQRAATPSDINEHMPRLRELARECRHVTEFGVRTGNSAVAFIAGCDELVSYDINPTPLALTVAGWTFKQADTGRLDDIAETDLLFIDTLHTCAQVEAELKHAGRVRKYLVFHDTVLFGCWEETTQGGPPGINHAIWQFLAANREWAVKEHHANNCGLLVLERIK